jgi:hypothetical protein
MTPRIQLHLPIDRNELETRYHRWKGEHPEVFALFMRFAQERISHDRKFSVKALVERVRWDLPVPLSKERGFRLNNSLTSYLARDLIRLYPRLASLIETRRVR